MRTREKIVFRLKQVIIMNEGFKSQSNKYKLLSYNVKSEQVQKIDRLIEYTNIEIEVMVNLLKPLYGKKFFRELEEKMYQVRNDAEEYYYKEMKKELNIH